MDFHKNCHHRRCTRSLHRICEGLATYLSSAASYSRNWTFMTATEIDACLVVFQMKSSIKRKMIISANLLAAWETAIALPFRKLCHERCQARLIQVGDAFWILLFCHSHTSCEWHSHSIWQRIPNPLINFLWLDICE